MRPYNQDRFYDAFAIGIRLYYYIFLIMSILLTAFPLSSYYSPKAFITEISLPDTLEGSLTTTFDG